MWCYIYRIYGVDKTARRHKIAIFCYFVIPRLAEKGEGSDNSGLKFMSINELILVFIHNQQPETRETVYTTGKFMLLYIYCWSV